MPEAGQGNAFIITIISAIPSQFPLSPVLSPKTENGNHFIGHGLIPCFMQLLRRARSVPSCCERWCLIVHVSVANDACSCTITGEEEAAAESAARNATFLLALSAALAGEGGGPEAS